MSLLLSNGSNIVRKYCIESICKKLNNFPRIDLKIYKDNLIEFVLVPICKNLHIENDHEIKLFIINKFLEFFQIIKEENLIILIIDIFDKVSKFDFYKTLNISFFFIFFIF